MTDKTVKNVATQLYDLLSSKNFEVQTYTSSGKTTNVPAEASVMSFGYKTESKNYGTVVALVDPSLGLVLFYGSNMSGSMEGDDRKAWYDFLYHLRMFAKKNLLGFSLKDISKLKQTIRTMAQVISEGVAVAEAFYGTKTESYCDMPKRTKIMIRHNRELGEGQARYGSIDAIFVETDDGERFRMPFKKLGPCRALARHISEGGRPWDDFGKHVVEMVNEMTNLRAEMRKCKDPQPQKDRYQELKADLKKIASVRGYDEYKKNWSGTSDQITEESKKDMREIELFESWVESVVEQTVLPSTTAEIKELKDLMSAPVEVGPDGLNAIELFGDLIGDDDLISAFRDTGRTEPESDARELVLDWIDENSTDYKLLNFMREVRAMMRKEEQLEKTNADQEEDNI